MQAGIKYVYIIPSGKVQSFTSRCTYDIYATVFVVYRYTGNGVKQVKK